MMRIADSAESGEPKSAMFPGRRSATANKWPVGGALRTRALKPQHAAVLADAARQALTPTIRRALRRRHARRSPRLSQAR